MKDAYTISANKNRVKVTRVAVTSLLDSLKGKTWADLTTDQKLDYIARFLNLIDNTGDFIWKMKP